MADVKIRENQWKKAQILSRIKERINNGFKSIPFIILFVFGIILIGGMGVWLIPLIETGSLSFTSNNLFTYSIAILGTMLIELSIIFSSKDENEIKIEDKILIPIGIAVGLIALFICGISYFMNKGAYSTWTIIGTIMTLFLFIVVNANDTKYDVDLDNAVSATGYKKPVKELIKDDEGDDNE